ncbi:hypothetical protein HMPREF3086_04495 [Dietzia sp. HMSC21D01]|uniref:hypothetical protein n=1 Tax=Dietzia TaxID=37914 RepID=UPI0008A26237|nr:MULTISPECIES: hypothetical protein [Dietzia]PWD96601.1 hypothetical protein DEQ16_04780 [Dietzia maris]MBM7231502.1 hypothetical protein [Dietzia cinnamea]MCT1863223.1 hypothetical protein [Dietzia cinnamea]MCT2031284.1 hypothetical protein [Dietzia cinnamea]MCT2032664.1 hypothetical protein [Dietzia cinnamea]
MDAHPEDLDRVVAVGMIGDPYRPRDRWLDGTPDPGWQGVAEPRRGPIPDRTHWVYVPGDPLSGVLPDCLLRGVPADAARRGHRRPRRGMWPRERRPLR